MKLPANVYAGCGNLPMITPRLKMPASNTGYYFLNLKNWILTWFSTFTWKIIFFFPRQLLLRKNCLKKNEFRELSFDFAGFHLLVLYMDESFFGYFQRLPFLLLKKLSPDAAQLYFLFSTDKRRLKQVLR